MKKRIYVIVGLVILIWAGWIAVEEINSNKLEIVFFDIGQGDSIYIETPNDFQVLIDGGPSSAVLEKLGQEMPPYDRSIDLVVLTHPDSDHLFGLLEVLKRYKVENILWTGVIKDTAEYKEWVRLIEEEQANIIIAEAGQKILLEKDNIYLEVLYPLESVDGQETKSMNNTSVVARLVFEGGKVLLTGDISKKAEKELVENYNDLESDILKIAHHGSKSSSCFEFIEAVNPEIAVISVGENSWGHPSEEVLQTLQQFGIQTLITKKTGDIKFAF